MAISLVTTFGIGYQAFDANGNPLSGGLLYTYIAGGTTDLATYTDASGVTANANPIVLGADGRPPNEIWVTSGYRYRFVLADSAGSLIGTYDGIPSTSSSVSGPTGQSSSGPTAQVAITPTLSFTVQPSNVVQLAVMSPAVQVSLTDGSGNVIYSYTGNITLAIGTGSSVLGGTTTVAAVNGVATFSTLTLSLVESGDTLVASATGMVGATSNTFNVTTIISYSSTATQTFNSNPVAMYGIGGDAARFGGGYDDTTFVTQDNVVTHFYRIDINTGSYTTHNFSTSTAPFTVDESGDIFFQNTAGNAFYKIQPNDTQDYFSIASTTGTYGTAQTPINTGPDLITFQGTDGSHFSSIDYVAHTATRTNVVGDCEMAKQNANISGGRVYCAANGVIKYFDTVGNTLVTLVSPPSMDSTCMIVDASVNIYGIASGGSIIRKYDNTGSLLGSVDIANGSVTGTYKLACYTNDGSLWANAQVLGTGTMWWKIKVSDMTVASTGTLVRHNTSLYWSMAVGTRFLNQSSPVLFTSNGADFYLGKMVPA
jgi:hypothetical protein